MTGRPLRCGSAGGRSDIVLHWRIPARLTEVRPGKWVGPCPKDGERGALNVEAGRKGGVIWNVPGCKGKHDRAAAYPALKNAMTAILANKAFTPTALRLAGLEAIGVDQDQALDMLGITASSNRRRARKERDA